MHLQWLKWLKHIVPKIYKEENNTICEYKPKTTLQIQASLGIYKWEDRYSSKTLNKFLLHVDPPYAQSKKEKKL